MVTKCNDDENFFPLLPTMARLSSSMRERMNERTNISIPHPYSSSFGDILMGNNFSHNDDDNNCCCRSRLHERMDNSKQCKVVGKASSQRKERFEPSKIFSYWLFGSEEQMCFSLFFFPSFSVRMHFPLNGPRRMYRRTNFLPFKRTTLQKSLLASSVGKCLDKKIAST